MEKRLENLIIDMERVTYLRNLNDTNPIVTRLSHPSIAKVTAIVCAQSEPSDLILPLNVTWFDLNPQSPNYRRALRRSSKEPSNGFEHTWELLSEFDEVFVDQEYDAADTELLTGADSVPPATTETAGTVRLSAEPENPNSPAVVVEGDPRLSDAREPTAHTHPQRPAVALRTLSSNVIISGSAQPEIGSVLMATSPTSAEWRKVKTSDIVN